MSGPLTGTTIIELQGIGPGPFCGMMLADMGADVIRIDRAQSVAATTGAPRARTDFLARGRRSVAVDLKSPDGVEVVLRLIEKADGLIEGFRPGVMERLGIGPDVALARNPKLVFGRMTGWGQDGPYAQAAGHDINYISLAGALDAIGRKGTGPQPPLNLIGDFGGGGMLLAFGMACGLFEAARSGKGQVIDAAMVDGSATLMTMFHSMAASGIWNDERGTNMLDTGSHFYDCYECSDGEYVSIGSIEPQFYAELRRIAGLTDAKWDRQTDRAAWPSLKDDLAAVIKQKSQSEWCALMEHTDVCFAPVLSIYDAPKHPHNVHRKTFVEAGGHMQPAPSPRFSRTEPQLSRLPSVPGEHTDDVLAEKGFAASDIAKLREAGAVK